MFKINRHLRFSVKERKLIRHAGLSLVEVLLTLSLLTIMVVILNGAMSLSKLMFIKSSEDSVKQGNLKRAIDIMSRDLSQGKRGIRNCPDDTIPNTLDNPNHACVTSTTMSFKVPEQTGLDGAITYKKIKYVFNSTDQNLERTEISSNNTVTGPIVIARQITNVSFVPELSKNYVQITLTASDASLGTEVFLRNK